MLYNRCTGIYKFGYNSYSRRIRCRSNLGHIFREKSASYEPGNTIYSLTIQKQTLHISMATIFMSLLVLQKFFTQNCSTNHALRTATTQMCNNVRIYISSLSLQVTIPSLLSCDYWEALAPLGKAAQMWSWPSWHGTRRRWV